MARRGKESSKDELPKAKITKASLKNALRVFKYTETHLWKFWLGLVFLIGTGATALVFPQIMGQLVDSAKEKDLTGANNLALVLVGVLLVQSVFSFFRISLFVSYTENTLANLRYAVYKNLIRLPMSFFSQQRVGEINSRFSADIGQIQDILTTTIAEFLRQIILIIGGVILLSMKSIHLTLLMLSIVPIVAAAAVIFGRFIRKTSREVQDKVAQSNTVIEETLQGISNVKAFANEAFEAARYRKSIDNVVVHALKGGQYRGYFASFIIFCLFGAIVAVVWYGVALSIEGKLSIGELISFVLYSVFVGASFGGVAELYAQIQKGIGASERVFELLDEVPEDVEIEATKKSLILKGNIVFENVVFHYPARPEMAVLNGVNFKVNAGEKIAVVGQSGAGKSTIAQLIMKFYTINSGSVKVDDKDISSFELTQLRNNMAIVPQDVLLFGGTIIENIRYGKPDASMEEVIEAARKANALDFINSFPEKFETIVGDRGIKLSGGQRQRIAIARAVLKNPAILILDEATSSLDAESERLVQEALDALMIGRTSVIIAHRLATIRKADKIIVLEGGKVIEQGSHTELLQKEGGIYRKFSSLQFIE